jgi:hypothetical protein
MSKSDPGAPRRRRRGRPKGAGNLVYRVLDHTCLIEMARTILADPELEVPEAAKMAAPRARCHGSTASVARRLIRKYQRNPAYYLQLARERARPRRPSSLADTAAQLERTWGPVLSAHERLSDEDRRLAALVLPYMPTAN